MVPHICHVIQELSLGGASRATIYLAKHSQRAGSFRHTIVSLKPALLQAVELAGQAGIDVISAPKQPVLMQILGSADAVQLSWWNNVELAELLKSELPAMRLIGWFHVGGNAAPQVVTDRLVEFVDRAVACSPYTYRCDAFTRLPEELRRKKTALVYGATDFDRLIGFAPRAHPNFNIGYIGTVDFVKMHPDYVRMSARARIPGRRFVVAGHGGATGIIRAQAREMGIEGDIELRGYADDIRAALSDIDVYGYPLCPDTYAASEMVLQEVMHCGIPAVVFPYGGVQDLVQHNETGLIVSNEVEYAEALEYLYKNPSERARIGANAKRYAEFTFGAENAAREADKLYREICAEPKRTRRWGLQVAELLSPGRVIQAGDIFSYGKQGGAWNFIESLGRAGDLFVRSAAAFDEDDVMRADRLISEMREPMLSTGLLPYSGAYPSCPLLPYWAGLIQFSRGHIEAAFGLFAQAVQNDPSQWRFWLMFGRSAERLGQRQFMELAQARVSEAFAGRAAPGALSELPQ